MADGETAVIKKRDYAEIIQFGERTALEEFMNSPMSFIAESMTGALASDWKALGVSAGRVVQGVMKAKMYEQFSREILSFRDKGKIADKFPEQGTYESRTWVELMVDIDEGKVDDDRLEAMKAMFYSVNKISATDADKIVGYQLFQIAKSLRSGELLLLKAVFERHKANAFGHGIGNYNEWANTVLVSLGHSLVSLLVNHERALVQNCLLTERERSGGVNLASGRLTDLGIRFCNNIDQYQIERRES